MDRARIISEVEAEIEELQSVLTALKGSKTKKAASPKKRRMSAAGRKAIGDAVRRRWAKVKAAKKG